MKKNIVLCSDGTGNKGGYGEDTNVYKIYKAVNIQDARDAAGGPQAQITFYDQGVGTDKSEHNKNKYWRALSGAFGFGFEANVKDLYHFLARSYETGDKVFLFGFSRGGATVRAFAGFVHTCGLLNREHPAARPDGHFSEQAFKLLVNQAFDCYRTHSKNPEKCRQFKAEYGVKDEIHAPSGDLKIHFVGVWDSVSALGFPKDFSVAVKWVFDAAERISDRIFPHSFYKYELNESVENAYQALSIDDERKTFHPMVWNEKDCRGAEHHVEQVWFAGVHSNVGGGYPRTGLSDVALDWMMTRAEASGLVFFPEARSDVRQGANGHDKVYDSRDGFAIYYRYGPRDLQELGADLRGPVALHRTAYDKLKDLSDAYAPDGLPASFSVVETDTSVEPLAITPRDRDAWEKLRREMKGLIQRRSMLYRVFVEVTMAILVIAGILWATEPASIVLLKSGSGILHSLAALLSYLTPVYFENFIYAVVVKFPFVFVLMLATLYCMNRMRKTWVNRLHGVCQQMAELL